MVAAAPRVILHGFLASDWFLSVDESASWTDRCEGGDKDFRFEVLGCVEE